MCEAMKKKDPHALALSWPSLYDGSRGKDKEQLAGVSWINYFFPTQKTFDGAGQSSEMRHAAAAAAKPPMIDWVI